MEIRFKSENGMCPYFIYQNNKFYIQDTRESNGSYTYALYVKDTRTETKDFKTNEDAIDFVTAKKNVRLVYKDNSGLFYVSWSNEYVVEGKKVIIRKAPEPLSGSYDKYVDCLKFAKKYIEDYIRAAEPIQLEIFN